MRLGIASSVRVLAPFVKKLHLVVRGPELEASMSRYLIIRTHGLSNVELHTQTEIVQLDGDAAGGLTDATFRRRHTGETRRCSLHHLFLFIGADPNTGWLEGCVDRMTRALPEQRRAAAFRRAATVFSWPAMWVQDRPNVSPPPWETVRQPLHNFSRS